MQGRFFLACLLLERRQRDLGDYFQDFLFICFQKSRKLKKFSSQAFVCLSAPEQLLFCRSEEAMGAYLNIMKFTLGLPLRIQSTIAGGHVRGNRF